jgi:hypothetical protein
MMKSESEAWTLFDNLSKNFVQHASTSCRTPTSKALKTESLFEASTPLDVTTKVDALSQKIDQLMVAVLLLPPFLTFPHRMNLVHFAPALHTM